MPHIRPKKEPTTPAPTAPLDEGFFGRVARRPGALSVADIERLIRFWTTYPDRWVEAYSQNWVPRDQARVSFERQYRTATRLLGAEAEKRALDSEPLEIAADLCRHALTPSWVFREIPWWKDEIAALDSAKRLLARLSVVLRGEKNGKMPRRDMQVLRRRHRKSVSDRIRSLTARQPGGPHQATAAPSPARGGPKGAPAPFRERGDSFQKSTNEFDAFLCHVTEDKAAVVRPFANMMKKHKLKPWLDDGEIRWGDDLAKKIQDGLARSRFVVVFLSSVFLSKNGWGDRELNTALSMEGGENTLVLPVVLGITHKQLQAKYPLVSAKVFRAIREYDPPKQVPPGELKKLVKELKNMIGVSVRGVGRGRP